MDARWTLGIVSRRLEDGETAITLSTRRPGHLQKTEEETRKMVWEELVNKLPKREVRGQLWQASPSYNIQF